jgi:hypothetical protein
MASWQSLLDLFFSIYCLISWLLRFSLHPCVSSVWLWFGLCYVSEWLYGLIDHSYGPLSFLYLWICSLPQIRKLIVTLFLQKALYHSSMVVHLCNTSTWEADAGRSQVWGQSEIHNDTLSQKKNLCPCSVIILSLQFHMC